MSKFKVHTPFTFDITNFPGERNTLPSKTVPDQTMSIREILVRYSRGLPIDTTVPMYTGEDTDGIDFRTLDISERREMIEAMEAAKQEYVAKRKAKDLADEKAKQDEKVIQDYLKRSSQNTTQNTESQAS